MEKHNNPTFTNAGVSGDGKVPAKTPWGASIRLPLGVTIPPADNNGNPGRFTVKLGLSCNCATLTWAHKNVAENLLKATSAVNVVQPDTEYVVELENITTKPITLLEGTSILNLSFLVASDFNVKR